MVDVIRIERKHGKYDGVYYMYSKAEAERRGLEYVYWSKGLADGSFLPIHEKIPLCLTESWKDENGRIIVPPMCIPVLRVNYNIGRVVKMLGRNAKELTLATRTWYIYANEQENGRVFFNPSPTPQWSGQVWTSLKGFERGFTHEHFGFFAIYLNNLTHGMSANDALLQAYRQAFDKPTVTLQKADAFMQQCIEYMRTGVDITQIQDAFKKANVDASWIVERLKKEATEDMSKASERMDALREILKLSGVTPDAPKENKATINHFFGPYQEPGQITGQAQARLPGRNTKELTTSQGEGVEVQDGGHEGTNGHG